MLKGKVNNIFFEDIGFVINWFIVLVLSNLLFLVIL